MAVARFAPLIPAEDHAHAFEFDNIARRFAAHGFDRVLIAQIETTLCRIESVRLPRIILAKRRIDTALRGNRMAADGVHFGENRDIQHGRCGQRRTHAREPCPDDQHIVNFHRQRIDLVPTNYQATRLI
jgi:hypothetical protein